MDDGTSKPSCMKAVEDGSDPHAVQRLVVSYTAQLVQYSIEEGSGVLPADRLIGAVIHLLSENNTGHDWESERLEISRVITTFMMLVFDDTAARIYADTRSSLLAHRTNTRQ
jgi:hypothetical protein